MAIHEETGPTAEWREARVALERLGAEHVRIRAKLERASYAGGGIWTPRLRRRQAELAEQLRAARARAEHCAVALHGRTPGAEAGLPDRLGGGSRRGPGDAVVGLSVPEAAAPRIGVDAARSPPRGATGGLGIGSRPDAIILALRPGRIDAPTERSPGAGRPGREWDEGAEPGTELAGCGPNRPGATPAPEAVGPWGRRAAPPDYHPSGRGGLSRG